MPEVVSAVMMVRRSLGSSMVTNTRHTRSGCGALVQAAMMGDVVNMG